MEHARVAAIDIGATSTKVGIVDARGSVEHHRRIPMAPPAPDFFAALIREVELLREAGNVEAIGVSVAGFIDRGRSAMIYNPNIPWLEGFPLRFELARHFHLPVAIEVDSNAAAMAEYRFGAGQGSKRFLCLTIGTGIGGGFIADGELVRLTEECIGDVGHIIVQPDGARCSCGGAGCAEAVAAAPAIVRDAGVELLEQIPDDDEAFGRAGRYIGLLCASLAAVFFPDTIVLGGGVCAASRLIVESTRREFERSASEVLRHNVTLTSARLGAHAPLIGGACNLLPRNAIV